MKKRKRPKTLYDRFTTTCGWCGKTIAPNTPVFGFGARLRPDCDLSHMEGQVMPLPIVSVAKTVLVGVASRDSEAKKHGEDLMFMTCSEVCAVELRHALRGDLQLANDFGLVPEEPHEEP